MGITDIIKEFPDVKVDTRNSRLNDKLLLCEFNFSKNWGCAVLSAICAGIETTGKFIGTNIDTYVETIAETIRDERRDSILYNGKKVPYEVEPPITPDEFLDSIVEDFASQRLAYAVIALEKRPDDVAAILKEPAIIRAFLKGKCGDYDPKRVQRTIIVPSEKLTKIVWGFTYNPEDLRKMEPFKYMGEQ